jgi:DNA/RNA endonuclease YhcR with UshA esterase domain
MYDERTNTETRPGRGARLLTTLAGLAAVVVVAGCDEIAPPITVDGTGSLEGLVFFDASEDGIFDPADGDSAIGGVALAVQERGTGQTFPNGSAVSAADGRFTIDALPLGTHDMKIDTLTVPDGVSICQNPIRVSVYLNETTFERVNGRPGCLITILAAKEVTLGEFVIVRGIVTSAPGQIEANFAYIEDATAGLFLFAPALMGQGINVGDQIEVGGTTTLFNTQFQLTGAVLREVVPDVTTPIPVLVTTAEIAASGSDPFDDLQNRFVRLEKAQLLEAFAASGNSQNSTIDDGSGTVIIRVDDGVADRNELDNIFTAGACYDINGFAANFNGAGQIFPRSLDDIVEVPCN